MRAFRYALGSLALATACSAPASVQEAAATPWDTLVAESYTHHTGDNLNTQLTVTHPDFLAGVGRVSGDDRLDYVSLMARFPAAEGDVVVAGHVLDDQAAGRDAHTVAAAYQPDDRWSVGGGRVELPGDADFDFTRLLYRNKATTGQDSVAYAVAGFAKDGKTTDTYGAGGIATWASSGWEIAVGHQREQEQARYLAGIVLPVLDESLQLRPALDVLHVDNMVGDEPGAQFTLAGLSLGHHGRFFGHEKRAGRLFGPIGILYPDPRFATDPSLTHEYNFNRVADPWAFGDLANIQYLRLASPDGSSSTHWDALVFPGQFDRESSRWDGLCIGWGMDSFGDDTRSGPLVGIRTTLGKMRIGGQLAFYTDGTQAGALSLTFGK
ncbi:MAG: hypothetical protein HY369_05210 [Candidatus Aenigmarchaeota archaeon]|nr:hypothetical protein [Candidatus Aenigmarchaeota archaeon]